jgi:hypothetical protein
MLRAHKNKTLAIKPWLSRNWKRRRACRVEKPLLRGSTQNSYPKRKARRLLDLLLLYVARFNKPPIVDHYRGIESSPSMAARKRQQRKCQRRCQIREMLRNPILDRSIPATVNLIKYSSSYWATRCSVRYGYAPKGSLFTSTSLGVSS